MPDLSHLALAPPVYAYLMVAAGTFVEGETLVLIGGMLAHEGYVRFWPLALAAFAGSVASDQLMFFLGRKYGKPFLEARPRLRAKTMRAARLINGHETLIILGFRFLYGLRNVIPALLGSRGVDPRRFLLLNLVSAAVWAVLFTALGYFFGGVLESVSGKIKEARHTLLIGLLIIGLAVGAAYFWRRWRK